MWGAILSSPNTSSWRGALLSTGQLYLYLHKMKRGILYKNKFKTIIQLASTVARL